MKQAKEEIGWCTCILTNVQEDTTSHKSSFGPYLIETKDVVYFVCEKTIRFGWLGDSMELGMKWYYESFYSFIISVQTCSE